MRFMPSGDRLHRVANIFRFSLLETSTARTEKSASQNQFEKVGGLTGRCGVIVDLWLVQLLDLVLQGPRRAQTMESRSDSVQQSDWNLDSLVRPKFRPFRGTRNFN
jgi:hypothetical protein